MYTAIVARLVNVRDHPNADRLKLATVAGSQVVVGLDAQEGELGIYFAADGKLSEEYCIENELFPILDEYGKKIGGGMFDPKNRRVRAQNLRSVKSDGYFASLESVLYTGVKVTDLYEGFQFTELNGKLVCEKYFTPKTLKASTNQKPTKKKNIMFQEHVDTEQFAYKADQVIVPGSIIHITEKLHGTSHRIANVIEESDVKRRWYHKLFGRTPAPKREWKTLHGTRHVVLGDRGDQTSFYGTDEFRYKCTETLEGNLRKGEVVYGEITGYVDDRPVMGAPSTKDLRKDPEFKALFPNGVPAEMTYSYNSIPGESTFWIYRITQVNEDGHVTELSWPQVKARANELGVKHVPELGGPGPTDVIYSKIIDPVDGELRFTADLGTLNALVEVTQDGLSTVDPSHIREGVVVRVDRPDGTTHFLKQKNYYFKVLEGIAKANEEYVDLEEIS